MKRLSKNHPLRYSRVALLLAICGLLATLFAYGQANGKLQIHFMDVGQGDGAVLISPRGQVVLFDDGVANHCDRPISYLQQLGVTKIDYHIASHYHSDHIGCAKEVRPGVARGNKKVYRIESLSHRRHGDEGGKHGRP